MGYGARARRVPALGGVTLTDVDIYKIALLCKTERGIVDSGGTTLLMDQIYSMNDFYKKCGGFNSSYYGAYIAQSFFDELENSEISCEMKVLSYVDAAAAQATYTILDGSAASIFTIKAGRLGLNDKSAFGNKIGIKITQRDKIAMKLTANVLDTATEAYLDNVDNLQVGYYIKFVEGSNTETRVITAIDVATKKVTFAAISESAGFTAAGTTVYRLDWKLEVFVKDELGNYQLKETWEEPFAKSDTIGMAGEVNDATTGSDFVILAVTSANASNPENQRPAALTTETPLTSGSDGSAPNDAAWSSLASSGLASTEFTILIAPESATTTHAQNMVAFTSDGYKGIAYVHAANEASEATLQNFGALVRGSIKFGMLPGDKWIAVNDPTVSGATKDIPLTGIAAAHWFNTYNKFGESKVAAGNKSEMVLKASGALQDANAIVHDDRDGVGSRLIRNYSINICKFTRGKGITINSARTFSTDDGYKYQNQVFQFILYMRSILAYLRTIEQDKSGIDAMSGHRSTVWSYMQKKYGAGHLFQGQKEDGTFTSFDDVCIIVNDFTINTLARINNGEEEIFVQFVAPPPIEEPILSLASAGVTTVST
jgi:hypothetical protein